MRALAVAGLVVALGAGLALVQYLLALREATAPPSPQAYVNASWQVYRFGPGHREHVGQMHLDCNACHRPQTSGYDRPSPAVCASCHEGRADMEHGMTARAPDPSPAASAVSDAPAPNSQPASSPADCTACHGFGPEPDKDARACLDCHAQSQGHLAPITAHAGAPCTECHAVHENQVEPIACTTCHATTVAHAHPGAPVAAQCLDCHVVHAASSYAEQRCQRCHTDADAAPARVSPTAVFGEHRCTGCHQPHRFEKQAAASCRSCHETVHVLKGHRPNDCKGCHDPHAVRESVSQAGLCASCHRDVTLRHETDASGKRSTCVACHEVHPLKPRQGPQPCGSCHGDIGLADQAHAGGTGCVSCHLPHQFALTTSAPAQCARCHAGEVAALRRHAGHGDCAGCHQNLPHGSDLSPVACGSCHGDQADLVTRGHGRCTQCHDRHTGNQQAACAQCHAPQATQHPRGHDDCRRCHEAHGGSERPGVADCSACHRAAKLPGLHRQRQHAEHSCLGCHQAHGTDQPAARDRCLGCHQEQQTHQPEARRCDGCHAFMGSR